MERDVWLAETETIRRWVNDEGVPVYPLAKELARALTWISDSPAHAVRLLGEAMVVAEGHAREAAEKWGARG